MLLGWPSKDSQHANKKENKRDYDDYFIYRSLCSVCLSPVVDPKYEQGHQRSVRTKKTRYSRRVTTITRAVPMRANLSLMEFKYLFRIRQRIFSYFLIYLFLSLMFIVSRLDLFFVVCCRCRLRVDSEEDLYRLWVEGYQGNATDSLGSHNGYAFSTFDRDNDEAPVSCPLSLSSFLL